MYTCFFCVDCITDILVQEYFIVGTPKDIIKGLEPMIEAGARQINFLTGAPDPYHSIEYARTLAKGVLPYFRS